MDNPSGNHAWAFRVLYHKSAKREAFHILHHNVDVIFILVLSHLLHEIRMDALFLDFHLFQKQNSLFNCEFALLNGLDRHFLLGQTISSFQHFAILALSYFGSDLVIFYQKS